MANTPIQLGSLNFDEIKANLKSFVQNSDNDLDIDFDGSVANTILDLLSYNTLYYAFYSNMLMNESFMDSAQRTESLISLSKPLGYTVAHRNCASASLSLNNTGTTSFRLIPYATTVSASKNGTNYNFVYINQLNDDDVTDDIIEPGQTKDHRFFQASSIVINAPMTVDYLNQRFNINNKKIDPATITVRVGESDGIKEYTRVSNTNSSLSTGDRVYYIESTNDGYRIFFGAPTTTEGTPTGRVVKDTEIVYVSYLTTSGSGANSSTSFTGLGASIKVTNSSTKALGGYDTPNLNLIKFAAPRNFVGGGRLVSISDYETEILNKGLISINSTDPKRNISVYGSGAAAEEVDGKVLFSLFDDALIGGAGDSVKTTSQVPEQIINDFADEILVGLTLQYREPLEADITFTTNEPASDFAAAYGRGFNQTFSNNLNSSLINLETTRIPNIQAGSSGELSGKFDFKNRIDYTTSGTTFSITLNTASGFTTAGISASSGLIFAGGVTVSNNVLGTTNEGRFALDPAKYTTVAGISLNYTPGEIKATQELLVNPKIIGAN
jgi:hypothetical protein